MKTTDWGTYRRLLGYLHGCSPLVIAALLCMVLEAFFTVASIASLKPVLDLLQGKPLTTMLGRNSGEFRLSPFQRDQTGTLALQADGYFLASDYPAFQTRLDIAATTEGFRLIALDLSRVQGLDSTATEALVRVVERLEERQQPVAILLPKGISDPRLPVTAFDSSMRSGVVILAPDSPFLEQFRQAHLRHVQLEEGPSPGFIESQRRRIARELRPRVMALQRYADESVENRFSVMGFFVALMIVLAALGVICKVINGYLSNMLAATAVRRLRDDLYRHMLGLDLSYYHQHSAGTLMSTVIQDAQAVDSALEIIFSSAIKTPITVGSLLLAMFIVSPSLTVATLTAAPVIGLIIYVLGRRVRKVSGRVQLVKSILSGILEESFNGMRIVKGYGTEEREAARFSEANQKIYLLGRKTIAAQEIGGGLTHLVGMGTIGLMVLGGGWIVMVQGGLSPADFVLFVGFLSQAFRPLRDVSKVNSKLQRGLAGCDRVFHTLDQRPAVLSPPSDLAIIAQPPRRQIEFREVTFSYGPDRPPALVELNLILEAGKSVAVVGETGSGKSTLANMLPRFHDPSGGIILWDGTDLKDFDLKSLRRQIALITQDVVLFDDTVAGNIAYGCEELPGLEEIELAAKAARAHDFIVGRMPKGYQTRIGARGVRLSGGERQRLAIARAILRKAPVLILDEATSALDSETESQVQQALLELFPGRTVLVIAHRLGTVQACDTIVVMSHGRIVEQGNHQDLLARDGHYARYHRLQTAS
jgi:subfamily B ATP-binding cassette protein MsbA